MFKIKPTTATILILTLLFFSCNKQKLVEISFANGSYTVTKPQSWKVQTELNNQADVQLGNDFNEAYAVVIVEAKLNSEGMNLRNYSKLTYDLLTSEMKEIKAEEPEEINITSYRAIKRAFSATIDGQPVSYWHISVDTKEHYLQMFLWSSEKKFKQNEVDFHKFMNSLDRA